MKSIVLLWMAGFAVYGQPVEIRVDADRYHSNTKGMLTWMFEFDGQPYFDGFRTLATNGVTLPSHGVSLIRLTW
jgi:hypothetical protein